ncbi:MAG: JmjC domain-containing protein [Streptosporangiaceae bacterium]
MSDQNPDAALARCVGDTERFAERVWGRRSQVQPSGAPATDLLSLADIDRLVTSSALRVPIFRLVKDGALLRSASYTTTGTIGGRRYDGVAAPAKVLRAMDDGATLVLQAVHRYHPPLARFCRDLELALGHRCQVNAYVTPPGARGLEVHSDPHDVLVMQSFGTKAWEVHPTPWQRRHEPGAGATEQLLSPGDVQYLPKGTPHAARSQRALSGHITVGIVGTTWGGLLLRAVEDLLAEGAVEDADETTPAGWLDAPAALGGPLADRLERLAAALRNVDTAAVSARQAERFIVSRPPLLGGSLLDRQRLADMDDGTRLVRRSGAVCRLAVGRQPDRVRLLLGDRELDLPAWTEPALTVLVDRPELRPGDLADHLDPESRLVLCGRLVREGLLSPRP